MLLLGRALVLQPQIIMLDEPSLGLASKVARQIFDNIDRLRRAGMTIILVQQNARMGFEFAAFALGVAVYQLLFARSFGDPSSASCGPFSRPPQPRAGAR